MKKKHPGIVVFILVLMFVASFGAYSETFLRAGMDYDSAVLYTFLYSILGMSFSAVIAMFIPFVCRLVCGHRLSYKSGKVICLINSILVLFAATILQELLGIILFGGFIAIGVIVFYYVNKWLFVCNKNATLNEEEVALNS